MDKQTIRELVQLMVDECPEDNGFKNLSCDFAYCSQCWVNAVIKEMEDEKNEIKRHKNI